MEQVICVAFSLGTSEIIEDASQRLRTEEDRTQARNTVAPERVWATPILRRVATEPIRSASTFMSAQQTNSRRRSIGQEQQLRQGVSVHFLCYSARPHLHPAHPRHASREAITTSRPPVATIAARLLP